MTNSEFIEKYLKAKLSDQQKMVVDLPSGVLVRAHRRFGKTYCLLLKMAAQWMQNPDKRFYFLSQTTAQSDHAKKEFKKIIDDVYFTTAHLHLQPEFRNLGINSYQSLRGIKGDYFYVDDYEWCNDDEKTRFALSNIFYSYYSPNKPEVCYTATGKPEDWYGTEVKIPYPTPKNPGNDISDTAWRVDFMLVD